MKEGKEWKDNCEKKGQKNTEPASNETSNTINLSKRGWQQRQNAVFETVDFDGKWKYPRIFSIPSSPQIFGEVVINHEDVAFESFLADAIIHVRGNARDPGRYSDKFSRSASHECIKGVA